MKGYANMHKVITMSNAEYFHNGEQFLKSRNRISAEFHLYGPDLSASQQTMLKDYHIEYHPMTQRLFDSRMQFMKFDMLLNNIDKYESNELITWCDFDIRFIQDWHKSILSEGDFDLGITYRDSFIKEKNPYGYANGGVFFIRNNWKSKTLLEYTMHLIENGGNDDLPEYDEIYKMMESKNRPAAKRCNRFNLRWDVDQIFLSALVMRNLKECSGGHLDMDSFFKFLNWYIDFFNCNLYNNTTGDKNPNIFIYHLKKKGRAKLKRSQDVEK
jgi:hypothetical protein